MTIATTPALPLNRGRSPAVQALAHPPPTLVPGGPTWARLLSAREHDVLRCLASGLSNAEIAEELVISVPTVKVHVAHLLRKTRARDRLQLVVKVFRSGYLQP